MRTRLFPIFALLVSPLWAQAPRMRMLEVFFAAHDTHIANLDVKAVMAAYDPKAKIEVVARMPDGEKRREFSRKEFEALVRAGFGNTERMAVRRRRERLVRVPYTHVYAVGDVLEERSETRQGSLWRHTAQNTYTVAIREGRPAIMRHEMLLLSRRRVR